jgi:hypothetical protein
VPVGETEKAIVPQLGPHLRDTRTSLERSIMPNRLYGNKIIRFLAVVAGIMDFASKYVRTYMFYA